MEAVLGPSDRKATAELTTSADSPLPELRSGTVLAGLFFLGLLGWAAFIPLDAGAIAEGVVAVSGNRQAVQHRDGGVVSRLNVVEGQTVAAGDLLLQLSAPELVAQERGMTGEAIALLAQRARLQAERGNLRSVPAGRIQRSLDGRSRSGRRGDAGTEYAVRRPSQLDRDRTQRPDPTDTPAPGADQRLRVPGPLELRGAAAHQRGTRGPAKLLPDGFVALNRVREMEREAAKLDGIGGRPTCRCCSSDRGHRRDTNVRSCRSSASGWRRLLPSCAKCR